VIGLGKQGQKHLQALQAMNLPIVVSDINKMETPYEWSSDPIQDPQVGAVVICTPTMTHFDLVSAATKANKKVFCEKPLTANLEEAIAIKALSPKLLIGFIYRYAPKILAAKHFIEQNQAGLGKPIHGIFRIGGRGDHRAWKHQKQQGGGAINEMMVHMLDLASWFLGPIHEIFPHINTCLKSSRNIDEKEILANSEDYVVLSSKGKDNCEILLQADFVSPSFSQYFEIQFEHGAVSASIQPNHYSYTFLRGEGEQAITSDTINIYEAQMRAFVAEGKVTNLDEYINIIELLRTLQ